MVRIYVETKFKGAFANCDGKYSIVLVTELDGREYSKVHYGAWNNTTPQRLQVRALIDAISYMRKPEELEIHISSNYAAVCNKNHTAKSNQELWQEFWDQAAVHNIKLVNEVVNEYSPAMKVELKHKRLTYLEDRRI